MEPITIERTEYGFTVRQGDRYSDFMAFGEMLELIVYLAKPEQFICGSWMKTYAEHSKWYKYLYHLNPNNRKEQLLLEMKNQTCKI